MPRSWIRRASSLLRGSQQVEGPPPCIRATTNGQAVSKFSSVSGTTTVGGTATLTATLTSSDGSPLMGESVGFTLDGAFAGVAVTNFAGVATLTGVATTDAVGTDTGGIVAYLRERHQLPVHHGDRQPRRQPGRHHA